MNKIMCLTWKILYELRKDNGFKQDLGFSQRFLSFAVRINTFARLAPIPQLTSIMPVDSQVLILYKKWEKKNLVANI